MNFYSVMTTIVHVDPATKQAVIDHVRPILDEWIGHADTLDHTSTYGIRTYYNGSVCVAIATHPPTDQAQMMRFGRSTSLPTYLPSPPSDPQPHRKNTNNRLRDHVDIGQTHIISAILNVAQDVDETWELHILDHEGRRHFVDMDAGDREFGVCV